MTAALFRRRAERFAQLLDEANALNQAAALNEAAGLGEADRLGEVTAAPPTPVRTRLDRRLARLVRIGRRLPGAAPRVPLDPDFRTGLRAMLVATAEREGIGETRSAAGADRNPAHGRIRWAVVVGVAMGAVAVSGVSVASDSAVPGDLLYGVKRSTERAHLALPTSDITRGQLYLEFARTRWAEAAAVRDQETAFADALDDMDAETQLGVTLLTATAVHRGKAVPLEAINRFVADQRGAVTSLLDGLPAAQRERGLRSLALLDRVGERSNALAAVLGCATSAAMTYDDLGPVPHGCGRADGMLRQDPITQGR